MRKLLTTLKGMLSIEIARIVYLLQKVEGNKKTNPKRIWIIGETEYQAQENGYTLYRWIREHHPDIHTYYVINKKSPMAQKLRNDSHIIWFGTIRQMLLLFKAERIISTHGLWMIPNGLGIQKKQLRNNLKAKRVMLNHGIGFLKNGAKFYHKAHFNLNDKIMCLSDKHRDIFINEYGYTDDDVAITGYPRFDDMTDKSDLSPYPNLITFMPTFRDSEQNLGDQFQQTQMYQVIEQLAHCPFLHYILNKHNMTLGFYLHQNIQKYNPYLRPFETDRIKVFHQGDNTVTQLLEYSKILITDYSSVLFDFVYMKKPFISYQFDYEQFISSRKERAFINFKNELPGHVAISHDHVIEFIKLIINDNFKIREEHLTMIPTYFKYQDKNNCARVFSEINKL